MRIGIIAEGFADIAVIKSVLKKLRNIDGSDIISIRPKEHADETDLNASNFSNWTLVLKECCNEQTFKDLFNTIDEDTYLIVHIDSAERGEVGYDVINPKRERDTDWKIYSEELYSGIKDKIEHLIPSEYREYVMYAITIEETEAWLIPIFENTKKETARYTAPKERLERLVGDLKPKERQKLKESNKKSLDYSEIGNRLKKELSVCRKQNRSLDLFCISIEEKIHLS